MFAIGLYLLGNCITITTTILNDLKSKAIINAIVTKFIGKAIKVIGLRSFKSIGQVLMH
jgi:hypothetical protein